MKRWLERHGVRAREKYRQELLAWLAAEQALAEDRREWQRSIMLQSISESLP